MSAAYRRRTTTLVALLGSGALQTLAGCSSNIGDHSVNAAGTGGAASGSGGSTRSGSGGTGADAGGSGSANDAGIASGNGGSGTGNDAGTATGTGGNSGSGGSAVTDAGSGGATGTDGGATVRYTCSLVFGVSTTYDWFTSGFEMGAGIDGARWEGLGTPQTDMSFIQNWADPKSPLWAMPKISPCAMNADNPDRVIAVGVNFQYTTAAQWLAAYDVLIATIKGKFPGVKSIYLDTIVRAPGDKPCAPGGSSEVVVPPFVDAAIQMAVTKYPGLVTAGPRLSVKSCDVFMGTGPHMTAAGKMVVAKLYSDYYAGDQ